jgi:hypothetical protein
MMSKTKETLAEVLAAAIRKGKFYHLFYGRTYLESYYYPATAKDCEAIDGCKVIYLSCSNPEKQLEIA